MVKYTARDHFTDTEEAIISDVLTILGALYPQAKNIGFMPQTVEMPEDTPTPIRRLFAWSPVVDALLALSKELDLRMATPLADYMDIVDKHTL